MPPKKTAPTATAAEMKQRLSVVIAPDVLERAKNVTFWSPGATLGGLVEIALVAQLDKLERKHGGPYPPRTAALRVGRPVR